MKVWKFFNCLNCFIKTIWFGSNLFLLKNGQFIHNIIFYFIYKNQKIDIKRFISLVYLFQPTNWTNQLCSWIKFDITLSNLWNWMVDCKIENLFYLFWKTLTVKFHEIIYLRILTCNSATPQSPRDHSLSCVSGVCFDPNNKNYSPFHTGHTIIAHSYNFLFCDWAYNFNPFIYIFY